MFGELSDFVGHHRKPSARLTRACCFDGRVQRQQVRLFGDVVNDVDDFRNFQGAVAERFDLLGGRLHRSANALHALECVADRAVALFGGIQSAACRFGARFGVVRNLFHGDRQLLDGA